MSYSFNNECGGCINKQKCTDSAVIAGAITGIHMMPFGTGHLGAGTITMNCFNYKKEEEK